MGGLFSVAVAGVVSYVMPMGPPPTAQDTSPDDLASNMSTDADVTSRPAMAPDTTPEEQIDTAAPAPLEPAQDSDAGADVSGVNMPLQAPQIAQDVQISPPADVTSSTAPDIAGDAPVLPNPMALAPMAPSEQDSVIVETTPAAPAPTPVQTPTAQPPAAPAEIAAAPVEDAPEAGEAETAATDAADQDPPRAIVLPNRDMEDSRPSIGTPAAITAERDTGVTVNRLPNATSTDPVDVQDTDDGSVAAIRRYGQPFANPDDKPLMSVLLIDEGSDLDGGEVGIAALRSFPYPISVAVDMSLPDAAERMSIYRDEGFEVLAMVDLPQGAQPSDAETTLGVAFSRLPEVVGILKGQGGGLQPDRPTADQVTSILKLGGFGLVTQDKGLNTMPKLALKEGVPAAPIFRDFDSKGQTATVIRRFLDQAAFKAGIEGSVIMLGRMRPETISALLVWGLQDRASQVALAPISAVLVAEKAE